VDQVAAHLQGFREVASCSERSDLLVLVSGLGPGSGCLSDIKARVTRVKTSVD
jgi:hypothetical protein